MNQKPSLGKRLLAAPHLVWSALFIIAPLIMVVYYAFTDGNGSFTLSNITAIPDYADTFVLSIWLGLLATVISLIIAYPLAYFISQSKLPVQQTMIMLVMLPMWMNFLLRTYSWMTILEDNGIINTILTSVGLSSLRLINTRGAVVLGMVYDFLPYMILPIYSVMVKLDHSLIEACQDLGGNKWDVFSKVILPNSISGIVSGITMVFVPSVSTFYISQKLGGTSTQLIGDVIERQFMTANNYHLGAALSLVLMVLILVCMAIMNHFSDGEIETGRISA